MSPIPLTYQHSFGDSTKEVVDRVFGAIASNPDGLHDLFLYEDIVFVKNREGTIVYANERYRSFFSPEQSPLGRHAASFLGSAELIDVSKRTDELIIDGTRAVDCECTGPGFDGSTYLMRTVKRDLSRLNHPGLTILGILRPEAIDDDALAQPRMKLREKYHLFKALEERDREICRQIGLGVTTSKMAEQFAMTSRGVELRKRKILGSFGIPRTVDLVKLLVRLQDNGFVDLGL